MITNERLINFIHSLEPDRDPALEAIRREALTAAVPIIRDETAALLKCLIAAQKPKAILEVGTAVGYSAYLMAAAMPEAAELVTIESYAPRVMQARENLWNSPYGSRIRIMDTDAGEALEQLLAEGRRFDFIFLDAAKAQYPVWLPQLLRLLKPGGMLLSDNILQEGSLAESRFLVDRRERTIHSRMREYLFTLTHHPLLTTSILPVGDGISLSVRKEELPAEETRTTDSGEAEA